MVCVYTAVLVAVAVLFRFYPKQDDSFVLTLGKHTQLKPAKYIFICFLVVRGRFCRLKNGRTPKTSNVLHCPIKLDDEVMLNVLGCQMTY